MMSRRGESYRTDTKVGGGGPVHLNNPINSRPSIGGANNQSLIAAVNLQNQSALGEKRKLKVQFIQPNPNMPNINSKRNSFSWLELKLKILSLNF